MRYGLDARYLQDHYPGIGRYTYNLARELARVAPDDQFVLLYDPEVANSRYDLDVLRAIPNVMLEPLPVPIMSWRSQVLLPRLARRLALELYHVPSYLLPYRMPCPCVATLHDLIPLTIPDGTHAAMRAIYRALVWLTVRRASHLLVDACFTASDLVHFVGADSANITVVPLAADDIFRPRAASEIAPVLERLGIQNPYLLYVGINKPHKNLMRLLEAWRGLDVEPYRLVWAGACDPRYPGLPDADQNALLAATTLALGPVSSGDLPYLYAGATALVFPSLYEGFGLPVLEAMASGTPVACSCLTSLPEVAGEAALLFDPYSITEMRATLQHLLTHQSLRQELASAGLERAACFTWEQTALRTLKVYRQVTGA